MDAASSAGSGVYETLLKYYDLEISKAVLGETGSTDQSSSGGSRARDQVGNEVRIDISKADADLLSETINATLVRWDVRANLPEAKLPKVWRVFPELQKEDDLNSKASRESTIVNFMGLKPSIRYIEETYGLPLEEPEEEKGNPLEDLFGTSEDSPSPTEQQTKQKAQSEEENTGNTGNTGDLTDEEIDELFVELKEQPTTTKVQSVWLKKDRFSKDAAINWITKNGFRLLKVDSMRNFYKFRQFSPNKQEYNFRTLKPQAGIIFVLAIPK